MACVGVSHLHSGRGVPHGPSRTWVSHRIRLGDRENVWNVYHHDDPGNVLSQNSCVGCPEEEEEEEGEEEEPRPHSPRHVSS